MLRAALISATMFATSICHAGDLTVATFNTESDDDTQPAKVAQSIGEIGQFDILAVQEVEGRDALKAYTDAAAGANGGRWRNVMSESGFNSNRAADFLGLIYNTEKFRQLGTTEIHLIRSRPDGTHYGEPDWSLRGALVLRLQDIATGAEFQIPTIHLKCCNEPGIRKHQAALLATEMVKSGLPTILLGDSNIPIEPGSGGATDANAPAFDSLTTGAHLAWIKPQNPVKTQCDPQFNSMLDQVYAPSGTTGTATIKFPEADYCRLDAQGFSDHRPIVAVLSDFFGLPLLQGGTSAIAPAEAHASEADAENAEYLAQRSGRPDDSVGR
jgi:endonuclease/exonuclease/phosphatase family metal-dependent hydrolase